MRSKPPFGQIHEIQEIFFEETETRRRQNIEDLQQQLKILEDLSSSGGVYGYILMCFKGSKVLLVE